MPARKRQLSENQAAVVMHTRAGDMGGNCIAELDARKLAALKGLVALRVEDLGLVVRLSSLLRKGDQSSKGVHLMRKAIDAQFAMFEATTRGTKAAVHAEKSAT